MKETIPEIRINLGDQVKNGMPARLIQGSGIQGIGDIQGGAPGSELSQFYFHLPGQGRETSQTGNDNLTSTRQKPVLNPSPWWIMDGLRAPFL